MTTMKLPEAVARACQEPSLVEALTWIAVWESERAIAQAREFDRTGIRTGSGDAAWDTCFRVSFAAVMGAWPKRASETLYMIATKVKTLQPKATVSDEALSLISGLEQWNYVRKWDMIGVWMSEHAKGLHVIWHSDGTYGLYERSEFEVLEQPCQTCTGSGRVSITK